MKILKVGGIVIVSLIVLTLIGMKTSGISYIGLGMHNDVLVANSKALGGYDAVAYHKDDTATLGNAQITYTYMGEEWNFSSEENRDEFIKDPEKYLPACGGYCLKAVQTGFTAPSDPTIFSIHNNRLVLFSSTDAKKEFEQNKEEMYKGSIEQWK